MLTRFVTLVIAVVGIGWSAAEVRSHLVSEPIRMFAEKVEDSSQVDWQSLQRASAEFDMEQYVSNCRTGLLDPIISIRLAAVGAAYKELASSGADQVDTALDEAEATLREALRCRPMDGHAWLRLAIVEARIVGPNNGVLEMLRMSYRTAPNEAWITHFRIPFVSQLYESGFTEVKPLLEEDIHAVMNWGSMYDVGHSVMTARQSAIPLYRDAFVQLPADRQKWAHRIAEKSSRREGRQSPFEGLEISQP